MHAGLTGDARAHGALIVSVMPEIVHRSGTASIGGSVCMSQVAERLPRIVCDFVSINPLHSAKRVNMHPVNRLTLVPIQLISTRQRSLVAL